jgi:hypothetical protein
MPELLRVKAGLLLRLPRPMEDLADACLTESLAVSRCQGALAWELRTSIDVARRLAVQEGREQARALLRPVADRFPEGSRTADLTIAEGLLTAWG